MDSGYKVTFTNFVINADATKSYTHKNRKSTQFAIDIKSRKETEEKHFIKISNTKVLITDYSNKIEKEFIVQSKKLNKVGPDMEYELIDKNDKAEFYFAHNINYSHFTFRFKDHLTTFILGMEKDHSQDEIDKILGTK